MTLDQLAESLIESLQKQDWPRALVLAWHGFHEDGARTTTWLRASWGFTEEMVEDWIDWLSRPHIDLNELKRRLRSRPVLLLAALDNLALSGSAEVLAQPLCIKNYWLVLRAKPYESTTGQDADLIRFVPHWSIVAKRFDLRSPSRTSEVFHSDLLFIALSRVSPTPIIYLVEFGSPPEFDCAPCRDWRAGDILNASDLVAEAQEHLQRARGAGADVVVFPELCASPSIRTQIAADLRRHRSSVKLVIAGSFHVNEGPRWFNQAFVLDGNGNQIEEWTQRKMTAVSLCHGAESEGIETSSELKIARTSCGLHAIAICLDLAQAQYLEEVPFNPDIS